MDGKRSTRRGPGGKDAIAAHRLGCAPVRTVVVVGRALSTKLAEIVPIRRWQGPLELVKHGWQRCDVFSKAVGDNVIRQALQPECALVFRVVQKQVHSVAMIGEEGVHPAWAPLQKIMIPQDKEWVFGMRGHQPTPSNNVEA